MSLRSNPRRKPEIAMLSEGKHGNGRKEESFRKSITLEQDFKSAQ